MTIRIMETADIHMHVMNWDYYQEKETNSYGLNRTATLIEQARVEEPNSILIDNGDLLQGNPLGDYAVKGRHLRFGETHPIYKAMNLLDYDVGNLGNHEFNYGLDFLNKAIAGANFPYISANVYYDDHDKNPDNDQHYFQPYFIKTKTFQDKQGKKHTLRIAFIGFVTPTIVQWDRRHLDGKIITKDIVETARKYVAQIRKKGVDILIAIPHSGLGDANAEGTRAADAAYSLSKVPGIDAMFLGHSHAVFPENEIPELPGIDIKNGTVNGVPTVMPGAWGSHLGIIDLMLKKRKSGWKIVNSRSEARPIFVKKGQDILPAVQSHRGIESAIAKDHQATIEWMSQEIGVNKSRFHSYFSLVRDDPTVQLVNDAQLWYARKLIAGTELEKIPLLSAASPFKVGGRLGASNFTDVPAGIISLRHVADIYVFANDLKVVKVNGKQLIEWIERSAAIFNHIKSSKDISPLINSAFRPYNFDTIDGITYEIDITQPSRYNAKGFLTNPESRRIFKARFKGRPIKPDQYFLVATNNYRANGGGNFPGLDGSGIVIDAPDKNRDIIASYLTEKKVLTPSADDNWVFRKESPLSLASQALRKQSNLAKNSQSLTVTEIGEWFL